MKTKVITLILKSILTMLLLIYNFQITYADINYKFDWKYKLDSSNVAVNNIWLIAGDSLLYVNDKYGDNLLLNVNTQTIVNNFGKSKINTSLKQLSKDKTKFYVLENKIYQVDAKTNSYLDSLNLPPLGGSTYNHYFTKDENLLVSCYDEGVYGAIKYFDINRGQNLNTFYKKTGKDKNSYKVIQVFMTQNGKHLIYINKTLPANTSISELRITDTANTITRIEEPATEFIVSDDESLLACFNSYKNKITIINLVNPKRIATLDFSIGNSNVGTKLKNFSFSKDNSMLSIGNSYGTSIFELKNFTKFDEFIGLRENLIFSNDNKYIYYILEDKSIGRSKLDTVTSIQSETNYDFSLQVQANELILTNSNLLNENQAFNILSLDGKLMKSLSNNEVKRSTNETKIDISILTTGIYFLQISEANKTITTKKFVKE